MMEKNLGQYLAFSSAIIIIIRAAVAYIHRHIIFVQIRRFLLHLI